MQWLATLSVRRPVLTTVLILVMLVVGMVGYRTLGVDKFPKVDFPTITITTPYAGASPSAVETDVVRGLELDPVSFDARRKRAAQLVCARDRVEATCSHVGASSLGGLHRVIAPLAFPSISYRPPSFNSPEMGANQRGMCSGFVTASHRSATDVVTAAGDHHHRLAKPRNPR